MEITKKYILTLLSVKDIEKTVYSNLDYMMKYILGYIGMNSSSSVYDCHKYLNEIRIESLYEDVEVSIQNLIKLRLIQTVTNVNENIENSIQDKSVGEEKPKNDTTSYSISSAGIFYLFRTNPENLDIGLLLKNKEDGLFINFLYPYLDIETLEKLDHPRTIMHINRFLGRCCETVQTELETIRGIEEKGGEKYTLGYIDGLANPEYDDGFHGPRAFLQGLKMSSKIKWIDIDNTKIIEIEKNKRFKIHDGKKHELYFEMYPKRNVAVLSDNSLKIKEFTLEKDPSGNYAITYFDPIMIEDYIDQLFKNPHFYFYYEIDTYEKEFCNSMLEYMHNEYSIMNEEERMIKRQDCIAIAKDKNFQYIANHFKEEIDSYYENFIKLSHIR